MINVRSLMLSKSVKRKQNPFTLLVIGFLLFSLTSCDSSLVYNESYPVKDLKWNQKTPFIFATDSITDINQGYNAYIDLRVNENYAYRNIYFFVEIEMPNKQIIRDTVNGFLQDEAGNWLEDVSGFGTIKQKEFLYRPKFRLPFAGKYKFSIFQAMRAENLEDVEDVGFKLKTIEQE